MKAVHVGTDAEVAAKLQQQWARFDVDIPLEVVASPYRSLTAPLLEYVDQVMAQDPEAFVAVIIAEFVPQHWRHAFLHNQSAVWLSFALRTRPNAVLISIRHALKDEAEGAAEVAVAAAPGGAGPAGSEPPS